MKKLLVLIAILMLTAWQANGQTPGCLYNNELYTTVAPGGKYGNSTTYGVKITPSADQCFYTTNPSPNACIICVYGVNPAGNCRSGLAPTSYVGLEASYALVPCPLDDYIPFLLVLIAGIGFFYLCGNGNAIFVIQ